MRGRVMVANAGVAHKHSCSMQIIPILNMIFSYGLIYLFNGCQKIHDEFNVNNINALGQKKNILIVNQFVAFFI